MKFSRLLVVAAVFTFSHRSVDAQSAAAQKGQTTGLKPLPRLANGKPDLSGIWIARGTLLNGQASEQVEGPVQLSPRRPTSGPYQPWALARVEELAKNTNSDPGVHCFMLGVPRVVSWPYPFKIVQTPKETVILYEAMHSFREIPTDGRGHRSDPDPGYMGDSAGHWEGDTLVVDVIAFNDKTWLIGGGNFHSEDLHVTERYSPTSDGRIHYEAIAEDPKVLTKPWTVMDVVFGKPRDDDGLLREYECNEDNRDPDHLLPLK